MDANIASDNWHYKEAAIMMFGCLLHTEREEYMGSMVSSACPMLINNVMNDPNVAVRDSSAWVLSQICAGYLSCIPADSSTSLIQCLLAALDMVEFRVHDDT